MKKIISLIIADVLKALYEPFWFALLLSVMFMFFYLYAKAGEGAGQGWKKSLLLWWSYFKESSQFRKMFFLIFYTTMILFRTLLNRNLWLNPLSNVLGNWGIYVLNPATGEIKLTTECIENFILFLPFSVLLLWYQNFKGNLWKTLWKSIQVVFLFSLSIEFLQLLLRLGTFQLSDLFYNTLGGVFGGLIYGIGIRILRRCANLHSKKVIHQ